MDALIAAVFEASSPRRAVASAWERGWGRAREQVSAGPVWVFATGKASVEMTEAALERLGDGAGAVFLTAVPERLAAWSRRPESVAAWPADHPLPTERNVRAAREALAFVSSVPADATLLALVSGGGSAHLTLPAGDVTLDDLRELTRGLQRAGASSAELNTVRKHCERLKGGRLAAVCPAARIVALVMSDVEGDRLDSISSGPFAADPTTFAEALAVLTKYEVLGLCPRVTEHLHEGAAGKHRETVKPGDRSLARVSHEVIASNMTARDAVAEAARVQGYFVVRDHRWLGGGAAAEGQRIGSLVRRHIGRGIAMCLIAGGEPVVDVGEAAGVGGPSQELALAAAIELDGAVGVTLAALSTDGVDGPTEHAGAIVTGETARLAREACLEPGEFLSRHDSTGFFAKAGGAIRTGPSGTNLNHVVIALIEPHARA